MQLMNDLLGHDIVTVADIIDQSTYLIRNRAGCAKNVVSQPIILRISFGYQETFADSQRLMTITTQYLVTINFIMRVLTNLCDFQYPSLINHQILTLLTSLLHTICSSVP